MDRLTTTNGNDYIQLKIDDRIVRIKDLDTLTLAKRLKEYEDLEEKGKLLKLPCKVGDIVYVTKKYSWHKPVEIGVFPKKVTEIKMSFEEGRLKCFLSLEDQYFNFDKIGKEVFLTKEEAEKFVETQEKREPENSLVGKKYLDKQRLPGTLKEVVDGPNKWGDYTVKDLKTGKEHLCSGRYIMQNEVDEKSFEEWWDELDDIEKEEYNAYMSEGSEELSDDEEIEK